MPPNMKPTENNMPVTKRNTLLLSLSKNTCVIPSISKGVINATLNKMGNENDQAIKRKANKDPVRSPKHLEQIGKV